MAARRTHAWIRRALQRWYGQSGRDLPWRRTRDPYRIAVSEVMLQQTQVARVVPAYRTFLRTFPTVKALAKAPLTAVLRQWSGLGYNQRAVRLRAAARVVMANYHGRFPHTLAALRALPGFGPYTAGAVATFAFRQRHAIVDTNVRRVLSRLTAWPGQPSPAAIARVADAYVPRRSPDRWQHALMDLGATVCISRRPRCEACPLRQACAAYPTIFSQSSQTVTNPRPPFTGSDRFWRGRIIRALVERQPLTNRQLADSLRVYGRLSPARRQRLLERLHREGLVRRRSARLSLGA